MLPFRVGEFLVEPQINTIAGNNKTTRIEPKVMQAGPINEVGSDWSPDGNRLVFGGSPFFEPGTPGPTTLQLIDLRTKEVSTLPGSEGL